ncbi:hypothetical protein Rhopal_000151-T1 [Rhodotorula paludigena]|uniref:Conserved oligomeric Golgi complex subunit 8 n=1 Tax=Rhodotorula paludigena TaxID=86838 RepID=A0AAV5GC33_9BASI|nr:hypothetical protein Rhopal_000151-T1 [Rhodotorula paludigena]
MDGPAAVASTSSASLDASTMAPAPDPSQMELLGASAGQGDAEAAPTLASLLLSTAESLAARSSSLSAPPARPSALKQPAQAPFALQMAPAALLNHPAAPDYLASLLAQPLSALEALPTSLSSLSTSLDNDLSSLAYTRYTSFLLSYTAAQSISASFATLSDNLSALLDSTSALEAAASSFESRVHAVREKRERMARVRERIEDVEELFEAPSVVDACVRAGHWTEAIDVAVRLEELHRRLRNVAGAEPDGQGSGALALVARVRSEVGVALLSLRARVLESLLQRSLKLPGAVRGIATLRRIAERGIGATETHAALKGEGKRKELDEDALRVVFLVARWRCLRGELDSVEAQMAASGIHLGGAELPLALQDANVTVEENEERTRWTKRWIEVWREVVGETVSMYAEVFLTASSLNGTKGSAGKNDAIHPDLPAHSLSPSAPLHLFLSTSLASFASVISHAIAGLNSTASLSSLLTQLTYCSQSFARYGLDFREWIQLRERIELRIGRIVAAEWEVAGRKWEKEWRDGWENSGGMGTTAARARRSGRVPLADWLVAPEGVSSLLATPLPDPPSSANSPTWHHQPSPSLALLPPVARFLNAHATALNSLRLIPPVSLYLPLRRAQAVELDRAAQVLAAFTDAWLASLNATPLPNNGSFDGVGADDLTSDEKQLLRERDDEKRVVAAAIAWFGRTVVPWCEGALDQGVYAELSASDRRPAEADVREESLRKAMRRCEVLVARIEGHEFVEDADASADEGAAKENGAPSAAPTELPVLESTATAVDTAPGETVASPVPTSAALTNGDVKPVDFSLPIVDADAADEKDAPYLVGESAPPAPSSAEESVAQGAVEGA